MTTGIENTGEVPGLASVASTKMAPASMIARPGARCSAPRNSAPGSSTAAHAASASGPMSSGWIIERWSTLRAPAASATGTERMQESCSTWVRRASPEAAASSPISSRCASPKRDRLDEDVQGGDAAGGHHLGHHLLHHRHPRVRGVALRDGVGQQRGRGRRLGDVDLQLAGQHERAHLPLARQPVARLALERGGAGGEHLLGQPRRLVEHLVVGGLAQRAGRGLDPAPAARDLLVGHAGQLLLVLAPAPAGERQMGVAVHEARAAPRTPRRRSSPRRSDRAPSAVIRPSRAATSPGSSVWAASSSPRRCCMWSRGGRRT